MRFAKTLCVAAVLLGPGAGLAKEKDEVKDTPLTLLHEAQVMVITRQPMKAAELYGDALALAHSTGDLQSEAVIATSLESFFNEFCGAAPQGVTKAGPNSGAILAAVMRQLDAGRCGAFVSAPVLAKNVLLLATETGDFSSVADAAKVAAAHAARPTSGSAAATVASYAEGLTAVADRTLEKATAPLDFAAAQACKEDWFELATYATTELAAAWVGLGAADRAADAVATTVEALQGRVGPNLVAQWRQNLIARLPSGSEDVRRPVEGFLTRIADRRQRRHGDGGAGGRPAPANQSSDIGELLPRLSAARPFVSAKRSPLGFEIRWATKPAGKPLLSEFNGNWITHEEEGGVRLAFFGRAASLRMVDLVGNAGAPAGGNAISPVRAYYLIAEGETWKVAKDGVVTITR